jgi:hypothetical protein
MKERTALPFHGNYLRSQLDVRIVGLELEDIAVGQRSRCFDAFPQILEQRGLPLAQFRRKQAARYRQRLMAKSPVVEAAANAADERSEAPTKAAVVAGVVFMLARYTL